MSRKFNPDRFSDVRILIVGDLMLDKFVHGTVDRVSPEAPIPVLRSQSTNCRPGGAANVAANIVALGARAHLMGMVAEDADGGLLRELLTDGSTGIGTSIFSEASRPTTVKTRFRSGSQQILRVDIEDTRPATAETETRLLDAFLHMMPDFDVVVISDYAKGVLTDRVIRTIISTARKLGKRIMVDPKRTDLSIYRGATMIKPNIAELRQATGLACDSEEQIEAAARMILKSAAVDMILITSAQGMWLVQNDAGVLRVRVRAREVIDVSGAGDSALAAFAVAFSAGHDPLDAMRIANAAAGVAVEKLGTASVTTEELATAMNDNLRGVRQDRIVAPAAAGAIVASWRARGLSVGFTNGCFDILHAGHASLLNRAARECDRLVIGLNSDASVARLKGAGRPVQEEVSRALVLASLEVVDLVVIFEEDTPVELIAGLRPDLLVKGADYTPERVVGADLVRSYGGRLVLIDLVEGYSTTNTVRRIVGQTD